jgi:glycosyltransferase involved in cell wall biosynthesis
MRILQVIPSLSKGGAERVVVELANALMDSGNEVTLLAAYPVDPELNQRSLDENVKVQFIRNKFHNRIFEYIKLPFWIASNWKTLKTYDVIHCHLTYGLIFGLAISFIRKVTSTKNINLVATCHSIGVGASQRPRIISENLSRFFDVFVLMAEDDAWRKFILGSRKQNFRIVKNGISPETWSSIQKAPHNKDRFTVGTISRLQSERKPWLFLEVFAHIRKLSGGNYHFVLGGDGPEKKSLLSLSKELGISQDLSIPGLVVHPSEILKNLDCYIGLNVEETSGIAGLEAIFSGIPVVSIQLSQKYMDGGKDWIFSNQDPQTVAKKIVELLGNPDEVIRLKNMQFRVATQNYSTQRMCNEYIQLYRMTQKRVKQ